MHKGVDYEPLTFSKIKALQEPSDRQSCGMGGQIYHFDTLSALKDGAGRWGGRRSIRV